MNKTELRVILAQELEGIPRGSISQNLYRMIYFDIRLNGFGMQPEVPATRRAAHEFALQKVRESDPDFVPDVQ